MKVAARAATAEDLPALAGLLEECASTLPSERGGRQYVNLELLRPPYADRLGHLLSDPAVLLLSGTLDDHVLALGSATMETLADGGRWGRLELLFVDPGAREVGLGEALVRTATAWARAGGAAGLDAYALPGNREAKNFLESSGFVARLIVMSIDLSGPSAP